MKNLAILGIDLGKNVCSLVGVDGSGNVVLRRRMKREGLPAFVERLPPCVPCGANGREPEAGWAMRSLGQR